MFQEVAEICLPLGSGNKADGAVKGGLLHESGPWLSLSKGRSLQKVFPGGEKPGKVSGLFWVWDSLGLYS